MKKFETFKVLWKNNKSTIFSAFYNNLVEIGLTNWIPDKLFLKITYMIRIGRRLDLNNPKGFNEKLQWLKLYDRNPMYNKMVDKYEAKKYVANIIGDKYIIPTLGVWNSFEEIDFEQLPDQFVLKCTHDSGSVIICKKKDSNFKLRAKKVLERGLKKSIYKWGREWVYKDVPHRILAEEYMQNNSIVEELTDYKFMCFNGCVKCIFTGTKRYTNEGLHITFFDRDWNKLPFERHYPADNSPIQKPKSLDEMILLAERLSRGLPFVRVDFYEVLGKPYFGEITFFPGCGFEEFTPIEWDYKLGDWIKLPSKWEKKC